LEWAAATKYVSIDLGELDTLKAGDFYANHGGYDTREINENPLRLVPFDVLKELESMGVIKSLNKTLYSTTGVATPIVNSQKIGQGIAEQLKKDDVDAVILTST
jgi:glycine reductase